MNDVEILSKEEVLQKISFLNERLAVYKKRLSLKEKGAWKYGHIKRKIEKKERELKLLNLRLIIKNKNFEINGNC